MNNLSIPRIPVAKTGALFLAFCMILVSLPNASASTEFEEERFWVAYYEKDTGRILWIVEIITSPSKLQEMVQRYEMDPYTGLHPLSDYSPEMIEAINVSVLEDTFQYIFDSSENRIREATEEESEELRKSGEMGGGISTMISCSPIENLTKIDVCHNGKGIMGITLRTSQLVKIDVKLGEHLQLMIYGLSGTSGTIDVCVSPEYISPENFEMYIDNEPLHHTIHEAFGNYWIHAEYSHSMHAITMKGLVKPPVGIGLPAWYTQPLNLALITLAIVAALGALYWFKLRR